MIAAMRGCFQGVVARRLAATVLIALLSGLAAGPLAARESAGVERLDGGPVGEAEFAGDVILVFFATWSPRCRDIVERAETLNAEWAGRAQVYLVSFQEESAVVEDFLAGSELRARTVRDVDGSFSKRHGITTLPSLLVLEGGAVAFRGRFPDDPASVLRSVFG